LSNELRKASPIGVLILGVTLTQNDQTMWHNICLRAGVVAVMLRSAPRVLGQISLISLNDQATNESELCESMILMFLELLWAVKRDS
jgi:hypothetical protein